MKTSVSTPQNLPDSFPGSYISDVNRPAFNLLAPISQALEKLLTFLSGNTEVKISQALDSTGEVVWYVYDPSTDLKASFNSETSVRIWLEQRYR